MGQWWGFFFFPKVQITVLYLRHFFSSFFWVVLLREKGSHIIHMESTVCFLVSLSSLALSFFSNLSLNHEGFEPIWYHTYVSNFNGLNQAGNWYRFRLLKLWDRDCRNVLTLMWSGLVVRFLLHLVQPSIDIESLIRESPVSRFITVSEERSSTPKSQKEKHILNWLYM